MLNPAFTAHADAPTAHFQHRNPFRHVVIDDYFDATTCASLLEEFPPFERGSTRNVVGELGNKSTVEKNRTLGPTFSALDDLAQVRDFLDLIGKITGVPGLLCDLWYFGSGTHKNRHGQDLDAHVDFNRHPAERRHRRLNLIVYLNREWDDAWGGSQELHFDPRDQHNQRLYRDSTQLTKQHEQAQVALSPGRLGRLRYFVRRALER